MSAIVKASELSKWFGEVVAVNNLSIEIGTGVIGLLGPNGAGKSTFMRLCLGLHSPSRGSIEIFGEPPRNNIGVLRRIGYCPEFDRFPPDTTGFEFVYWMNRYAGMDDKEAIRKAEETCEQVSMSERMDDLISEYSRGMRQRIKIAQALALSPELIFLDEPMAGLDPQGREEIFSLIRDLGQEGRTVIVSSHILYEIERVTNHIILMHNGCILASGDIHDVRELIDEHPLAVTIDCESPREMAALFTEKSYVLGVEIGQDSLTVRTGDPNAFFETLNTCIREKQIIVNGFRCADADLQSVFEYLIR